MQQEIEKNMQVEDGVNLLILGDMNARMSILEANIETDANGIMIEEWINGKDMTHLNRTEKCIGKFTFGRPEGRRSAIDHVLVNNKLYEGFKGMTIDENGEEINISDHNLVRSWFKIGREKPGIWNKPKVEYREWYTLEQGALEKMEKEVEKRINGPMSFKGMMAILVVSQEKHLKRTKRVQIGKRGEDILSAPWIDKIGLMLIRLRRVKSRAWRRARRKNALQREQTILKRKYELQKKMTAIYLGKRKSNWEQEMIQKAKTNNKVLWNFAKDMAGKTKKKDEKAFIYMNGEKKDLKLVWESFIKVWKEEIYQKAPKMDLTFWYGSDKTVGLKEIMRREEAENRANGESKMMPLPIMKEEEMMNIIKRQKNGKAAGIDGIKAETMKFITRNRKIRRGLLNAFNKCLKEKVCANWLESYTPMLPKTKKKQK